MGKKVHANDEVEAKHAIPLESKLAPHSVDNHKNAMSGIRHCESGYYLRGIDRLTRRPRCYK